MLVVTKPFKRFTILLGAILYLLVWIAFVSALYMLQQEIDYLFQDINIVSRVDKKVMLDLQKVIPSPSPVLLVKPDQAS